VRNGAIESHAMDIVMANLLPEVSAQLIEVGHRIDL
jgi:hypothetical protein